MSKNLLITKVRFCMKLGVGCLISFTLINQARVFMFQTISRRPLTGRTPTQLWKQLVATSVCHSNQKRNLHVNYFNYLFTFAFALQRMQANTRHIHNGSRWQVAINPLKAPHALSFTSMTSWCFCDVGCCWLLGITTSEVHTRPSRKDLCRTSARLVDHLRIYKICMLFLTSQCWCQDVTGQSPYTGTSQFVPTTKRIAQFSEGREPKPNDRIIYCAGAFDLFRSFLNYTWFEYFYGVLFFCHHVVCK